jgi:hypothetical protein
MIAAGARQFQRGTWFGVAETTARRLRLGSGSGGRDELRESAVTSTPVPPRFSNHAAGVGVHAHSHSGFKLHRAEVLHAAQMRQSDLPHFISKVERGEAFPDGDESDRGARFEAPELETRRILLAL